MFPDLDQIDERQFKALTGLTRAAFCQLLPLFIQSSIEIRVEEYEKNIDRRQRKPGGGQKGRLNTMEKKLFFILYYLKVYPTFDVLGDRFDLDRSKACTNVHSLLPVLLRALDKAEALPARQFETVEEMRVAFADIAGLLIDATERPRQRPQDNQVQQEHYSGKKKRHTVKNSVMASLCQQILFLGYTVAGSRHDYSLLKSEFAPDQDWFATFKVWLDLGYLGFQNDYTTLELNIPHKKPRKSKANPKPALTAEQKTYNQEVSRVRIVVENAICRMKRFRALTDVFRNRVATFIDDVALAAAGLANWSLALAQAAAG
jgi:hypothetical protein